VIFTLALAVIVLYILGGVFATPPTRKARRTAASAR